MRKLFVVIAMCAAAASCAPAFAEYEPYTPTLVIHFSPGGAIGDFVEQFVKAEETGQHIIIDGECISSCTLALGLVDRDHICTTSRGYFGFHSSTKTDEDGQRVYSPDGTAVVWNIYPPDVREWLKSQGWDGGEHTDLIFAPASQFVSECKH
jgi:hypothetical protein